MATYGGAVDLVLTELARSDTSITAVVEREILKAVEFYSSERFWFNEARTSFTASSTIYYPFSSIFPATAAYMAGMVEIDQLSITVGSDVYELDFETHQAVVRLDSNANHTGDPVVWALFGEKIRLYPMLPAGTTRQIDVDGTRRLATLSASTDTNSWTSEGLQLITARAEKSVCARRFKDYDAAQAYQLVETEEYTKLKDRTERLLATGRLRSGW